VKRVSTFLIAVALIAGMVGCNGDVVEYDLTITSTTGGNVTVPGEGTFTYNAGTVVNLMAEADEGYQFVNWTANVSAIADVNATATNITMNSHYSITANFAPEISENLEIWDWYDLDAVRNNLGGNHTLMNDLDFTTTGYTELASPTANGGKGWRQIGIFTGTFDGQGHEICDLFINRPGDGMVGLFVCVDEGGHIEDIGVVNATVTGKLNVGVLVGLNLDGTVSNSYSTGSVTGDLSVGGLVGFNVDGGTISNSYSNCNVTGEGSVGGLVGVNAGTVSNSYSTGSVTGEGTVGGLMGANMVVGLVSNSYSTGSVKGDVNVGGFMGHNTGTVSNSYSTGSVTGNSSVGGLVGDNYEGAVSNSFWDIVTSGQSTSDGGTGKNTTEMQNITTFSGAAWNIIEVGGPGARNPAYIWNIVNGLTYPFLSWQP
jgi:hypothetical protein